MYCIDCGKKLNPPINYPDKGKESADAIPCNYCGNFPVMDIWMGPLANTKGCSYCGKKNFKSAKFCYDCGKRL